MATLNGLSTWTVSRPRWLHGNCLKGCTTWRLLPDAFRCIATWHADGFDSGWSTSYEYSPEQSPFYVRNRAYYVQHDKEDCSMKLHLFFGLEFFGSPGIWVTQCVSSKIIAVLLQVLKWLYMVLLHRYTACVGNISAVSFSFKDKESKVKRHESRGQGTRTKDTQNKKKTREEMGVSKNRGTPKSSILIRFHIINHPFCSFVFIFRCLFVVLLRGVKRLAKPATSVSLARNRGLLWKITRHRSFCTFFSSKIHYPSFSTKMWLKTALTPIFVLRLPKKTHDNPKKLGDKNTLNF